jgi:hypothetical protein
METTILSIVNSIRALIPEGAALSLTVHPTHASIILHDATAYCIAQGATIGAWYSFEGETPRPQRNYEWWVDGVLFSGVESIVDAGITVEEALAQNEAAKAALAA